MKVLLMTHHFPPVHVGGVELITLRAARWLKTRGVEIAVVCVESVSTGTEPSVRAEVDTFEDIPVWRLHLQITPETPFGWWPENRAVAAWLDGFLDTAMPTLVHVHSAYLLSGSVIEIVAARRIPLVVSLHDYWFFCSQTSLIQPSGNRCSGPEPAKCAWCLRTNRRSYRFLDRLTDGMAGRVWQTGAAAKWPLIGEQWAAEAAHQEHRRAYLYRQLQAADAVITQARMLRDMVVKNGIEVQRVTLNPYGLELRDFENVPPCSRSPQSLVIGYLGNIHPIKGVHILVEAFRQLQPRDRMLELHIYGPTDKSRYGQRLGRLAAGDRRIQFRGRYDNRAVAGILASMDVLVVPSVWYETGPLVTLEAFACHVPVGAADLPNMAYQVTHEQNGLLYAADEPAALSRALQRLIDEPDLLPRLRAGIGPVRTAEEEMAALMTIYHKVAQRAEPDFQPD